MSAPQHAYISCPVFEIFYGGSRGSLKTDGSIGDWMRHSDLYGEHAIGLMVRRERTQLLETMERAREIMVPLGFMWHEQDKIMRAKDGSRLRFAYLERDSDAEAYQGHSYTRIYVEEIGNFPDPQPVMKLMATLRSAHGVPCGFRATGNPGGPGHGWVKARYITPAPDGWKIIVDSYVNPWTKIPVERERIYIPGRISDHNLLGPEYIANLQMSGSPELVRAWLEGDWDIVAGAYFPEFTRTRHVIVQTQIPAKWKRFTATDWGSSRPFWTGWFAIAQDELKTRTVTDVPVTILPGALVCIKEWYGQARDQRGHDRINVGLELPIEDWALGVLKRTLAKGVPRPSEYDVVDSSMFDEDGGPSLAERAMKVAHMVGQTEHRLRLRPSDKRRIPGWNQVRARLKGDYEDAPPMLYIIGEQVGYGAYGCAHLIRTLSALQHDENDIEDADTDGEDHAPDALRYACMSRPRKRQEPAPGEAQPKPGTMDFIMGEEWKKNRPPKSRSSYHLD